MDEFFKLQRFFERFLLFHSLSRYRADPPWAMRRSRLAPATLSLARERGREGHSTPLEQLSREQKREEPTDTLRRRRSLSLRTGYRPLGAITWRSYFAAARDDNVGGVSSNLLPGRHSYNDQLIVYCWYYRRCFWLLFACNLPIIVLYVWVSSSIKFSAA